MSQSCGNCNIVGLINASSCYYVNGGRCSGSRGSCRSCSFCNPFSPSIGCSGCQSVTCDPDSSVNIAAIIGGVIAGVFVLALIIGAIICCTSQRYHYSNYYGGGYGGYGGQGQGQTMVITNQSQQPTYPTQPHYPTGYEQPVYPAPQPYGYAQQQQPYSSYPQHPYPQQPGLVRTEEYSPTEPILPGSIPGGSNDQEDPKKYPKM